ncbi:MAG: hypothetical protein R3C68_05020 [Myxococcota bacterium]
MHQLTLQPQNSAAPAPTRFNQDDVLIFTGGARGITAHTAIAIAEAGCRKLALLGRSPQPTPEPTWLGSLTDEAAIKAAIAKQEAGLNPKRLQERYRQVANNRKSI